MTSNLADLPAGLAGGTLRLVAVENCLFEPHALPRAGTLVLGRGEDADLRVPDASVSRRHARLYVGPELAIECR